VKISTNVKQGANV